jgi:hypothetical protein
LVWISKYFYLNPWTNVQIDISEKVQTLVWISKSFEVLESKFEIKYAAQVFLLSISAQHKPLAHKATSPPCPLPSHRLLTSESPNGIADVAATLLSVVTWHPLAASSTWNQAMTTMPHLLYQKCVVLSFPLM